MQSYSQDLRDRVLRGLERGDRPTDIAARFEVSREWVYDVKNRFENEGLRHRLPVGGHRVSRVADKESLIRGWIKERKDLTLSELCERLAEHGVNLTPSALWYQLDKWNLSFKKNAARQRARARRRRQRAG
jgi:transposase